MTHLVDAMEPRPQLVVLDLAASPCIDLSVADMLRDLQEELRVSGLTLKPAEVSGPVRHLLKADGLAEKYDPGDEHQSVQQVIDTVTRNSPSLQAGPNDTQLH
ncbi:MAG: sodium-independent anion transporter [Chloroflexi bacterium]|nr:sodium-independent anion transporter [Chloroflexota bacterium]